MIAKMGYPSETHEVITEDGYILNMHRIPFGKNSPLEDGVKRPAIYLQHGLLCSSADWVMWTEEKSLGVVYLVPNSLNVRLNIWYNQVMSLLMLDMMCGWVTTVAIHTAGNILLWIQIFHF